MDSGAFYFQGRGFRMLVFTRKTGDEVVIGENITIRVQEIRNGRVILAIDAPKSIPVHRKEVSQK